MRLYATVAVEYQDDSYTDDEGLYYGMIYMADVHISTDMHGEDLRIENLVNETSFGQDRDGDDHEVGYEWPLDDAETLDLIDPNKVKQWDPA